MVQRHSQIALRLITGIVAFAAIGGYALYQARNLITGPVISITEPYNGGAQKDSLVEIKGQARNISAISLNDRPIYIDESGYFVEKLLLEEGYNIMKLKAQDKFGRSTEKTLELVLEPSTNESLTINQ